MSGGRGTSWSIVEVARYAGVSSRTLRHYDDVGLLPPAYVGSNGYRYYGRDQLLRLQQVLLLRELGLSLSDIRRLLDGAVDRATLLREHHAALLAERDRLDRLAETVARTIETGGLTMRPEELFEGFDAERQRHYEEELVERYGEQAREHIEESWRRVGAMTKDDADRVQAELAERDAEYAALLDEGVPPDDPRTQDVTSRHHAWVCRFWTPTAEAFAGLGDLYVDHPEFRARYEAVRPGLAEYVRDAMAVYAVTRLT